MTILPNYIAEHASTPVLLILLYVAATGFTIGLQVGYFKDRKELFGSKLVNAHLAFTIVGTLTFALFSAMMWLWAAKYSETINQRANRLTYGLCAIFLLRDLPLFAIEYTAILNEGWRDAYQGFAFIMTLLFFLLSGVYSWLNYLWLASRYLNSIFGAYSSGGGLKTGSEKLVVLRPASPTEVHSWDRELLPPPGSARRGGAIDFSAVNSKRGSAANSRMGTPSRGSTAIDSRYSPPPLSSLSSGAGRRGQHQFADGHPSESNRNAYSHGQQQQMSPFPYTTLSPVTGNGNNNFNSMRGPHSSSDSPRRYDSPRTNGAARAGWGDSTNDTNYNTTGGAADSAADHHYSPPPLPQQSYSPDHTNRHQGSPQNNYLPPRSQNNERSYRGDGAEGSGLAHHHQLPATFGGGGGEVEQQLAMLRARQQRGGGRRSRRGSVASSGGGGGGGYTTANSNQLYSNTGNTSQFNNSNYYSSNTNNNDNDLGGGGVRGYDGYAQPLSASVNVNGQSPSRLQVGSPARGVIRMEGTLSGPSSPTVVASSSPSNYYSPYPQQQRQHQSSSRSGQPVVERYSVI